MKGIRLELNVATYNPACFAEITNKRKPKGKKQARTMRLKAIRAQLQEMGIVIAGFQEMRGKEGKYTEDGYLHVTTGGHNNNHGVGFLLNLVRPYAVTKGREFRLQEQHVRVTHSEPTRMVIKLRAPHLEMTLMVAHAPQSGVATALRKEWWAETDVLAHRWTPDLMFCDANGRVKSNGSDETAVGDKGYNSQCEDSNGAMLRDLAVVNGLSIMNTLRAKPGDYILAGEELSAHMTDTWVDHDFDHGLRKDDHFPLIAAIEATYLPDAPTATQRYKLDPQKLQDPERVEQYRRAVAALRPPDWRTDVNEQYRKTIGEVNEIARKWFAKEIVSPIQPYISRETMRLIRLRRHSLRAVRQWRVGGAEAFDNLCKHLPRQHEFYIQQGDLWAEEGQALLLAVQLLDSGGATVAETGKLVQAFLHNTKPMVREMLVGDRMRHIDAMGTKLAETAETKDALSEWNLVRRVLRYTGRPAKKSSGHHLPLRKDKNGVTIRTNEELAEEQLPHFGKIEDAVLLDNISCMAAVYNERVNDSASRAELSLNDVPSRYEVEQIFRRAEGGKAPGPDALAGELLSMAPCELARVLHPLYTKICLQGQEPLAFKHGHLAELAKGVGNMTASDSYRSILLVNTVAKCYFKFILSRFGEMLEALLPRTAKCGDDQGEALLWARTRFGPSWATPRPPTRAASSCSSTSSRRSKD